MQERRETAREREREKGGVGHVGYRALPLLEAKKCTVTGPYSNLLTEYNV